MRNITGTRRRWAPVVVESTVRYFIKTSVAVSWNLKLLDLYNKLYLIADDAYRNELEKQLMRFTGGSSDSPPISPEVDMEAYYDILYRPIFRASRNRQKALHKKILRRRAH